MSVLLVCDAPNCMMTTPAVVRSGRPAAPDQWWMQPNSSGVVVVGCCERHFTLAQKRFAKAG